MVARREEEGEEQAGLQSEAGLPARHQVAGSELPLSEESVSANGAKVPESAKGQPMGIETLVLRWAHALRASVRNIYACLALLAVMTGLIFVLPLGTRFAALFGVVSVVLGAFLVLRTVLIVRDLHRSWREDLILPLERLMQTINMISAQRLELLPEERRMAFTSAYQQRLLEVARGILEHQRFVDQVVDNMFEMMFLLNPDGVILKVNKSACETTGFQATELVGQHIRKLFPHAESLVDHYLELEIQFTTLGLVRDMEVHVQTSDGEILPFSLNGVKIESSSGDLMGYTLIAKNLAETFRLIHQLNKSNNNLNRANGELEKRYDQIKREIEEQEAQKKVLELELATSQLVQKTFLPQTAPVHTFIEMAGTAVPAAFCGGDWWNTISLEDRFYVFIGDVTGHGTASAMVTAAVSGYYVSVRNALLSGQDLDVAVILAGFDSVLSTMANGDVSYNMTCFAGMFDFKRKIFRFANAGHNFPLMYRPGGKIEALVAAGHRLGSSQGEPFETLEVEIQGGEFLFLYTDGLIENRNDAGDMYGKRRLRKFIETHWQRPSAVFVDALLKDSLQFFGDEKPLEDDVTFIAAHIRPLP